MRSGQRGAANAVAGPEAPGEPGRMSGSGASAPSRRRHRGDQGPAWRAKVKSNRRVSVRPTAAGIGFLYILAILVCFAVAGYGTVNGSAFWSILTVLAGAAVLVVTLRGFPLLAIVPLVLAAVLWGLAMRAWPPHGFFGVLTFIGGNLAFDVPLVGAYLAAIAFDSRRLSRAAVDEAVSGRRWWGEFAGDPFAEGGRPEQPGQLAELEAIPAARFFVLSQGPCSHLVAAGRRVALIMPTDWGQGTFSLDASGQVMRSGRPFAHGSDQLDALAAEVDTWRERLLGTPAVVRAFLIVSPSAADRGGALVLNIAPGEHLELLPAPEFGAIVGGWLAAQPYRIDIPVIERLLQVAVPEFASDRSITPLYGEPQRATSRLGHRSADGWATIGPRALPSSLSGAAARTDVEPAALRNEAPPSDPSTSTWDQPAPLLGDVAGSPRRDPEPSPSFGSPAPDSFSAFEAPSRADGSFSAFGAPARAADPPSDDDSFSAFGAPARAADPPSDDDSFSAFGAPARPEASQSPTTDSASPRPSAGDPTSPAADAPSADDEAAQGSESDDARSLGLPRGEDLWRLDAPVSPETAPGVLRRDKTPEFTFDGPLLGSLGDSWRTNSDDAHTDFRLSSEFSRLRETLAREDEEQRRAEEAAQAGRQSTDESSAPTSPAPPSAPSPGEPAQPPAAARALDDSFDWGRLSRERAESNDERTAWTALPKPSGNDVSAWDSASARQLAAWEAASQESPAVPPAAPSVPAAFAPPQLPPTTPPPGAPARGGPPAPDPSGHSPAHASETRSEAPAEPERRGWRGWRRGKDAKETKEPTPERSRHSAEEPVTRHDRRLGYIDPNVVQVTRDSRTQPLANGDSRTEPLTPTARDLRPEPPTPPARDPRTQPYAPTGPAPLGPTDPDSRTEPFAPTGRDSRTEPFAPTGRDSRTEPFAPTGRDFSTERPARDSRTEPFAPTGRDSRTEPFAPTGRDSRTEPIGRDTWTQADPADDFGIGSGAASGRDSWTPAGTGSGFGNEAALSHGSDAWRPAGEVPEVPASGEAPEVPAGDRAAAGGAAGEEKPQESRLWRAARAVDDSVVESSLNELTTSNPTVNRPVSGGPASEPASESESRAGRGRRGGGAGRFRRGGKDEPVEAAAGEDSGAIERSRTQPGPESGTASRPGSGPASRPVSGGAPSPAPATLEAAAPTGEPVPEAPGEAELPGAAGGGEDEPKEGKRSWRQSRKEKRAARAEKPDATEEWLSGLASNDPPSWDSARGPRRRAANPEGLGLGGDDEGGAAPAGRSGRHSSSRDTGAYPQRPARGSSLFGDEPATPIRGDAGQPTSGLFASGPSRFLTDVDGAAASDDENWWDTPKEAPRGGAKKKRGQKSDWASDPTDEPNSD
jgi:hypothetical protein